MNFQDIITSGEVADLNKILPVVQRVHGEHHPELLEVGTLYRDIIEGIKSGKNAEELVKLSEELCKVTNGFAVPEDACVTFAKTYKLLSKLTDEIRNMA